MKRCPQCDFIYDDDQKLCDMDGGELERVPAASPAPPASTALVPRTPTGPRRRRFTILLISGITSGAILTSGYYLNTSRQAAAGRAVHATPAAATTASPHHETTPVPESPSPAAVSELPSPAPEPAPEPATTAKPRPAPAPTRKRTDGAGPVERPATKPSPRPATAREAKSQGQQNTNGKQESKLGAALKKTGRILKKPFGF